MKKTLAQCAVSTGAVAVGAVAFGATAIGALAIGVLAIRRLGVLEARFKNLHIERLTIGELDVRSRTGQP